MANIRLNKILILAVLIFVPLLLFRECLFSFFSQDDFFHLRVVMDKNIPDIPSFFFSRQQEYAFYRPLSRETYNLLMYKIFKLNPLPYHVVNLLLIITNSLLILIIVKKISNSLKVGFTTSLIYSLNALHSVELYYLASIQTLLAANLMLISVYYYLKPEFKNILLSLFLFILALTSHETAVVLPGILLMLSILIQKKSFMTTIKSLAPFIIIALIYLGRTSLLSSLPGQQVYQPVFSIKSIFNTLMWYVLWSFNLPEMLVDFVGPNFKINPNLIKWYGQYLTVIIPLLILSLLFFIYSLLKIKLKQLKIILFFLASFLITLSPFLFFPQHKSIYYLSFASLWFSAVLGVTLSPLWRSLRGKISLIGVLILFAVTSIQTVQINKITYWAAKRAVAAKYIISDFKKLYPAVDKGTIIIVRKDPDYPFIAEQWGSSSKQAFLILSGSDAFKLIYQNPKMVVYFEDVDYFNDIRNSQAINYIAKFPY